MKHVRPSFRPRPAAVQAIAGQGLARNRAVFLAVQETSGTPTLRSRSGAALRRRSARTPERQGLGLGGHLTVAMAVKCSEVHQARTMPGGAAEACGSCKSMGIAIYNIGTWAPETGTEQRL